MGEQLGSVQLHDLRAERLDSADQLDFSSPQRLQMIGWIWNIDELSVLIDVDTLLGKRPAHVDILSIAARGGYAERLAGRLVLGNHFLQRTPVFRRDGEIVGHQHSRSSIHLAGYRNHVETLIQSDRGMKKRNLPAVDALP